jgi:hypothetical protein
MIGAQGKTPPDIARHKTQSRPAARNQTTPIDTGTRTAALR